MCASLGIDQMVKAKKITFPAARVYLLLSSVVEGGITCGVRRAFKHTEMALSEDEMNSLVACIEDAVLDAICEAFEV